MNLPPGVLSKPYSEEMPQTNTQTIETNVHTMTNAINNEKKKKTLPFNATPFTKEKDDSELTTTLQWLLTMLLYSIPIVNIIYMVLLFVRGDNEDKMNWAKAAVIVMVISYMITIISIIILKNISLAQLFDLYIKYKG